MNSSDNDNRETDELEAVRSRGDEGRKDDSQETTLNEPIGDTEKEPWSILDIPQAFSTAANGTAMATSAMLIFVILIAVTIPRYIAVTLEGYFIAKGTNTELMPIILNYIFNGLAAAILIMGVAVSLGTLAKVHHTVMSGSKRLTMADTVGYLFRHGISFILSPLKALLVLVAAVGIEIGGFYLARIPFVFGLAYFPLFLWTAIVLICLLFAYLIVIIAEPAIAIDAFTGKGSFEQAHLMIKKQTGRVVGYSAVNGTLTMIAGSIFLVIFFLILCLMQCVFINTILETIAVEYYTGAKCFLVWIGKNNINPVKSVMFLLSSYVTIAVFFAYVLSLFSALHTVGYLALKEDLPEV